jgi:RimJ/RimL family protein N-acetyltransferase
MLMRPLASLARAAGLDELAADVLPENSAMRRVLGKYGFQASRSHADADGIEPVKVDAVTAKRCRTDGNVSLLLSYLSFSRGSIIWL